MANGFSRQQHTLLIATIYWGQGQELWFNDFNERPCKKEYKFEISKSNLI